MTLPCPCSKLGQAEALSREVLASQRATLGSQHPSAFTSMGNLGLLLEERGKLREAEALLSEALSGLWRVVGSAHRDTRGVYIGLLRVLTAQGKARDVRDVKAQYGGRK